MSEATKMAANGGKAPTRKHRTAMSCDRCKSRKTKCNSPVPGPCDYCKSIQASCQIDAGKRKQRPYYFVSEEEFRLMGRLLKRCFPDHKLDLPELRHLLSQLENNTRKQSDAVSLPILPPPRSDYAQSSIVQETDNEQQPTQEGVVLEEIASLHEDLGCMLRDARGHYRYIGADAGISFNAAVRDLHPDLIASKSNKDIIPGMKTTPQLQNATVTIPASVLRSEIRLPPIELANRYVRRYFDEVHCLYWLYAAEQFYSRLKHTYSGSGQASASWVCSIYSIFALGSLSSTDPPPNTSDIPSSGWLAMAKALVSRVFDEADLDSIRALVLLALALQSHGFSNRAYLHAGTAVRIAYSLGLHVDKYSIPHGAYEKEHARRIWWTLYVYDQEIALRVGKPWVITAYGVTWQPPLPSDTVLSPGRNTPSGYLEVSMRLTQLTKETSQILYVEPLSGAKKLLSPRVTAILAALREWANSVPSHLSQTAHVAPEYKRSVALLHVRYWSVIILATRPFLLCSILRQDRLQDTQKRKCYDELSNICIDAAHNSLTVLQMMEDEGLLSSLVPSDFNYTLELVQVFLLAFARDHVDQYIFNVRACLGVLKSMDDVGWTQKCRPEVINQLHESGVLDDGNDYGTQDFTNFLTSADDSVEPYDTIFTGHQANGGSFGDQSLALAEMDFGDAATSEEMLQQLSNLSRMPQFSTC